MEKHRIYSMIFASVYPMYVAKAVRKGRTQAEVDQIICWLTGYTQKQLQSQINKEVNFETFFASAPQLNPHRSLIKGVICGVRIEEITDPLMREIRYLDKLIDELAKGRPLEKIFRLQLIMASNLLQTLKTRFDQNPSRHPGISWSEVELKLNTHPQKLEVLEQMEATGGEPDVIGIDPKTSEYLFCDCSPESPIGRRSLCYDRRAFEARKQFKPKNTALDMAESIGIELLTEDQYQHLQTVGEFDLKTSSWLLTPAPIRQLGGAIFADRRYNHVFIYHNGADSYYASRGFRGLLRV